MNSKKRVIAIIIAALALIVFFVVYTTLNSAQNSKGMGEEWIPKTKKVKFKPYKLEIDNEWFLKDFGKLFLVRIFYR